ncbi:unnamed protein product [Diamesa tonsa]
MVCNFSAQEEGSAGKSGIILKTTTPETSDLLTKLRNLQIRSGYENPGNRMNATKEFPSNPNSTTSKKKGIIFAENNVKKVQIKTPEKSSTKNNVPGKPKQNFPSFEETMAEYNRNLSGTPKSSHSPRTKTTPNQEHRKKDLPGTPKSPHSPRTKNSQKQDLRRSNLPGTPKSPHSPITKTFPTKEFRRSDLPPHSKSPQSPRTKSSPKAVPQRNSKAVPTVPVKKTNLRTAFDSLNFGNFNNVKMQIIQSNVCSDTQLPKCVNVIFLKSMENHKQIPLYVRMCKEISKSLQKMDQFKLHLTNKCKSEVSQFREQARPNDIQNRKMLSHRALPLGTIIGELYKAELLTWSTIMSFMQSLVDSDWISEGSVGLICNLLNSLGKSYKRDGGNNFILSGIDVLAEKCIAKSFSKSTCNKVQKMKELHHGVQSNVIQTPPAKPNKIERSNFNEINASSVVICPILATINIDNYEESFTKLIELRKMSEEHIGENVRMLFLDGIAKTSTATVCAKLLKNFYPEKIHLVKKEIQLLINEELRNVRKDLLLLQDSKHGENSAMELKVYNLSTFIAELYKVGLVAHDVVFNHLQRLNDAHFRNEISVKLCCVLLCYIGGKLEKDVSRKVITAYIKRLGENVEQFDSALSDSILEVKELQLNNWQNTKPTMDKMEYSEAAELVSVTEQQQNPSSVVVDEMEILDQKLKATMTRMEYSEATQLYPVIKQQQTSNPNVTSVIRNFMESSRSSKELMSNIKALISPENINEVTIECFCEFIKIAASENIEHLNVKDLYECFEKLKSILKLYRFNVISLCSRTSLLIEEVLILRNQF